MFSVTSIELSGRTVISALNFSMRNSRVVSAEASGNSRTAKRAAKGQRNKFVRKRIVRATIGPLRRGCVEADLGRFSLGRCGHFKKLACLEAQHVGKDIRGELLNLSVEVADDGVVITASVLHSIFNL